MSQVAFISGAGSGLGQLAAKEALSKGWRVAAIDLNATGLEQLGASDRLLKLTADVTDRRAVDAAVATTEAELGNIHRVIHAAAIMPLGLLLEQDQDLIHKIMTINYGGLVNVTRATLPGMLARGRGDFISFSSSVGHIPVLYMGAYTASKFAVSAFTEILYRENRNRGVRFACVCPPMVATPLLNQARNTVWPKLFEKSAPIDPQAVLAAVEKALQRGDFWVWPGRGTEASYRLRRWWPSLFWHLVHKAEGR